MAFDPASFNSPTLDFAELPPIFRVEPVQLQFPIAADLAAVQVANNVVILALVNGLIMRIDLANPQEVDDILLQPKGHQVGVIRKIFLDPTASHLIITTTNGENFYLHSRSTKPKPLPRLKNVYIECVAWSPALPTVSTREILIGDREGHVFETYVEGSEEGFMRREERYMKLVFETPDKAPVTGLWMDTLPGNPELRRVVLTTPGLLAHWVGKIHRHGHGDVGSVFTKFFDVNEPHLQDFNDSSNPNSMLVVSPDSTDALEPERNFAWLTAPGVYHGRLLVKVPKRSDGREPPIGDLGAHVLSSSKLFSKAAIQTIKSPITAVAMTQYHLVILAGTDVYAVNRLDGSVVFQEAVVDPGQKVLGLCSDAKKATLWAYTNTELFEIEVIEEDRDIWKIMLGEKSFDAAMRFAKNPMQKDEVMVKHGDYLIQNEKYLEAAKVYGGSSKSFEEVSLAFLENGEQDALREYLLGKLAHLKKTSVMQRIMVASWLIELFMSRLNSLEDSLSTISATTNSASPTSSETIQRQLTTLNNSYQDFILKYKSDLDRATTYEIISSHGRERELLFYANIVNDYTYVLSYYIQREKYHEALSILQKQTSAETFYKYSSVLMANLPTQTVDILLRQTHLEPRALIPALLNYNKFTTVPISSNQAVRYLLYQINTLHSTDPAVHNTLISIYASSSSDESHLLSYLESTSSQHYDLDFALRLCIHHNHVKSCVHIYSSMEQYSSAVQLALKHSDLPLASIIADRPDSLSHPGLRKKLWLQVAAAVIKQTPSIKTALDFLSRCELLKIEDLIPFFPDFTRVDDFKDSICQALEAYSAEIDRLKREMEESAKTAERVQEDVKALDRRYAIVEPGEGCALCGYPLLSRQFWVFPCEHAMHADCLVGEVVKGSGVGKGRRIEELGRLWGGEAVGGKREKAGEELEALVAGECCLCGEYAVRKVDEPFLGVGEGGLGGEWAV